MSGIEEEICGTCRFWDFLHYTGPTGKAYVGNEVVIASGDVLDCKRFPRYEKKNELETCGEWKPRYKKQILHESKE